LQRIIYLKYLSNGNIASCSADYTVSIWDPYTWLLIRKYIEHLKEVYCIDQIDTDILVSASLDSTLRIWRISTGLTLSKIELPATTYTVRVLSNGLITCGLYGVPMENLLIFNYTTRLLVQTLIGHYKTIYTIEIFTDDLMASGSSDTKVIVWNLTTFKAKYTFFGHRDRVFCIKRLSSNIVASADRAGVIIIWDWLTNVMIHKFSGPNAHSNSLWSTSMALFTEHILISGSTDKTLKFWNISSGQLVQTIDVGFEINALAMLKTGSKLSKKKYNYSRPSIIRNLKSRKKRRARIKVSFYLLSLEAMS
jgi:WD40 repeat protein